MPNRETEHELPQEAPAVAPTLLTAEQILSHKGELPTKYVSDVWGGTVKVKGLSGRDRDRYETSFARYEGGKRIVSFENARAKLVALTVVDEQGKRVFTDQQVRELGELDGASLDRVFEAAQELSGLGENAVSEMVNTLGNAQSGEGGSA